VLDILVTNTAREHGCHFVTLVFTGRVQSDARVHGPWTLPVDTARGHG